MFGDILNKVADAFKNPKEHCHFWGLCGLLVLVVVIWVVTSTCGFSNTHSVLQHPAIVAQTLPGSPHKPGNEQSDKLCCDNGSTSWYSPSRASPEQWGLLSAPLQEQAAEDAALYPAKDTFANSLAPANQGTAGLAESRYLLGAAQTPATGFGTMPGGLHPMPSPADIEIAMVTGRPLSV